MAPGADLALGALPVVAGHVVQELQHEADAGGVGGVGALGAVEELFRLPELVAHAVAHADLALGAGDVGILGRKGE